jgi:hypothetical protein
MINIAFFVSQTCFAIYSMYTFALNAKKKDYVTVTEDARVLKDVACDAVDETGPSSMVVSTI